MDKLAIEKLDTLNKLGLNKQQTQNTKLDVDQFDIDNDLIRMEVLNTRKKSKSIMSEIEMLNSANKDSGN